MKTKTILSLALVPLLFFYLSCGALAVQWEEFTDVSGHWAEETVKKGVEDGLIDGFEDNTVRPDAPITTAQMITILCRILNASETADTAALDIPSDAWYAQSAAKALSLGLICSQTGDLDAPMSRQNALSMMAKAFRLVPADPDLSVLNSFSDAADISAENKGAMATLASRQLIQGFAGSINSNGSITRAEFLTVLCRVALNYVTSSQLSSSAMGGTVVKGSTFLYDRQLSDTLWFDCSAASVSLSGVTAASSDIVLLSHKLAGLTVDGGSVLQRLVVGCGSYSISLAPGGKTKIGVLQLDGSGSAKLSGNISAVEVTGSGITLSLDGKHDYLIVAGSGNTVTLGADAEIGKIIVLGSGNTLTAPHGAVSCGSVSIKGRGNLLHLDAGSEAPSLVLGDVELFGDSSVEIACASTGSLTASGENGKLAVSAAQSVGNVSVTGKANAVKVEAKSAGSISVSGETCSFTSGLLETAADITVSGNANWLTLPTGSVGKVEISGDGNTFNKSAGGTFPAAQISGNSNAVFIACPVTAIDITGKNNKVRLDSTVQSIAVKGRETTVEGAGTAENLTLDAAACSITVAVTNLTDNSNKVDEKYILSLVSCTYKGNYTLQWALDNDYEDFEKEVFVNVKEYSSKTSYLLWINLAMQRVNIFEGSRGSWKLIRECIIGTGAPGSGTPVGVYDVTYKQAAGWTTSSYTCKPVVGFYKGTGYAFHSRLYYPNSSKLKDTSIGYPISHGCARMYDEDIAYIYDNIPIGSTVVVY